MIYSIVLSVMYTKRAVLLPVISKPILSDGTITANSLVFYSSRSMKML